MPRNVQTCQLDVGNEEDGGVKDNDISSTNDFVQDSLTALEHKIPIVGFL